MTESEFLTRWHAERDMYAAWGLFVKNQIIADLDAASERFDAHAFLKIPPEPRTKGDDSLIGKAFYRNKAYADPYRNIEDKVGVRFVVLLTSDIKRIQQVIERSTNWTCSLDRDYEAERETRPLEFTYQSTHYVLKASNTFKTPFGVEVHKDTPCEVQIRTLLQHAHSELTHDNIYKREAGSEVAKTVERTVAKSMALIEAVDDYFMGAVKELNAATRIERDALDVLTTVYSEHVGIAPQTDVSNRLVLQAFRQHLSGDLRRRLTELFGQKPFIAERVRGRAEKQYLFRQPWILLAYLLVDVAPAATAERWPLTPEELRPVYTDLGRAFPTSI
ncbi:GTP pyrophosphokinase [Caballeronia grimmiae]|uniref:GTP pyrophosphokinase n=1 Tax=Caballeronia grimmiae TaxID=1071679 RepID=UPI0038B8615D